MSESSKVKHHLPLFPQDKSILPTGKSHISYSEAIVYHECSFRHKLIYIDGLRDEGNEHTLYGGEIHSALEDWLLNRHLSSFNWDDRIEECHISVLNKFNELNFNVTNFMDDWLDPIDWILRQVPTWLDTQFPNWKVIAAEFPLFEPIASEQNRYFKGFIDNVLIVPKINKRKKIPTVIPNEFIYWILDWKVTSWGWSLDKKTDKFKRMQLALYKHYLSTKLGIPLENIKCGFVLLKRISKKHEHVELIEVSVGDKTRTDALEFIDKQIRGIARGLHLKNKYSCTWCRFKNTPECP